jgi:SAM-dependent methyltransferase
MSRPPSFWDERYAAQGFAFGTTPNEFLVACAGHIPAGRVLSLGEGEGRNAVFLAGRGHALLAVDQSLVGLQKAAALARERGLSIETRVADLAEFAIEPDRYAGIVSIFCHLPPSVRAAVHAACARGLQPGGVMVLEAYTPAQLGRGTGGPSTPELLVTLAQLRLELAGLEFVVGRELEREVVEGRHHTGIAAVVQVLARRP